jgi:hypothetical protein
MPRLKLVPRTKFAGFPATVGCAPKRARRVPESMVKKSSKILGASAIYEVATTVSLAVS